MILGGKKNNNQWRSGGRFTMGYWFDSNHCFGAEANYGFLPRGSHSKTVSSDGSLSSPTLLIPFYDVTIPGESYTYLSAPGNFSGTATLKVANNMQAAELNGLIPTSYCFSVCEYPLDFLFLAGFRYWNFDEKLTFSTSSPFINAPDDVFKTDDKFEAKNNFYGGQVGLGISYHCDKMFINFKGKVALGAMCEEANIRGKLALNDFTGFTKVQHFEGGYFALPTNIGRHKQTRFSAMPELEIDIGYEWSHCLSFHIGYTFLYVSDMLWAAKAMDRNINPSQSVAIDYTPDAQLVGQARPKARLKSASLTAQGLTAGITYSF